MGEVPYVLILASAMASLIVVAKRPKIPGYAAFFLFSSFYFILSLLRMLPTAWTAYYDAYAALRQWSWVVAFPILTLAVYNFLKIYGKVIKRNSLTLAMLIYAVTRLSMLFFGENFRPFYNLTLYSINNDTVIIHALLLIFIFSRRRPAFVDFVLLLLLLAASTSSGSTIASLCALVVRFFPLPRLAVCGLVLGLVAALLLAPFNYLALDAIDPNASLRALFWWHSIEAVSQTAGAGVGYGTEYIKNEFWELGRQSWTIVSNIDPGRLFISNHSTFYDVFLRLGVIGIVLFLYFVFRLGRIIFSQEIANARQVLAIFMIVFVNFCVNPALVTIDTQIGMCVMIAWLLYERNSAVREASA